MTETQERYAAAVAEHGGVRAAARALGVNASTVSRALARAGRVLPTPDAPVPEGYQVERVTTIGPNGRTVVARPEPDAAPYDVMPEGQALRGVSTYVRTPTGGQWIKTHPDGAVPEITPATFADWPRAELLPAPRDPDADLCTWYPLGDPHVGMLSWAPETGADWDSKIARATMLDVLGRLVAKSPASTTACLANMGDYFHAEGDDQMTPRGKHKLDVDTRASKVAALGCQLLRDLVDLCLQRHAHVRVFNVPGNHDPRLARWLALWLSAVYEREPRVTVEPATNVFQFWAWGANAVMLHHGDGTPAPKCPGVFACDPSWGPAVHRYVYTGHIHSHNRWDLPGCSVESFRTLAPNDAWAHGKGYRGKRTLDAITLHRERGEVSRVQEGLPSNAA